MNYDSEYKSSLRDFTSTCAPTAFGLCAALTASALSPAVNAQAAATPPSPGSTNAPATLPDVVVTGQRTYQTDTIANPRIAVPLRDTPQTINVVPRAVIEDQNATTLRDVLRNVPGISFQAGEGGVPAGDQLAIRGFGARTDIFVDGVRDVGGYTRDSFNLEQVEVFKGPNSTYSGRGSTGGSVNMVSKNPKLNQFYNSTLSYGSYDYYRGTIDLNQPIPQLDKYSLLQGSAVRLNALYHDQDFSGRDYIHDNRWALNPTFATGLGRDTRIILSYLHLQENNLAGYGHPFVSTSTNAFGGFPALGKVAPVPYHRFFGLINRDHEDIVNDIAGLRFEHDFSDNLKLANQTRYGRTYRDSVITAPRYVLPTTTAGLTLAPDPIFGPNTAAAGNAVVASNGGGKQVGLNHELQSRDQTTEILSNQTDLRSNFETGRFAHALVTTLEFSHEREKNFLRIASGGATGFPFPAQTSDPTNPDVLDPHHPVFRTSAYNEAISDSAGISVFDTIKITDQWLLTAGARGDVFSTSYFLQPSTGQGVEIDRTDAQPTWRAGLTYKPKSNGSIFFGYGTSFNPSGEGLTLTAATAPLDPEFGQSFELGTKWDFFDERLSVSAAMFRTDKDNFRNTDPVTGIISVTGDVRVQGIEFGVAGKITDAWGVFAGYTLMESEILKSSTIGTYNGVRIPEQGKALSNTPSQTVNLSTTYDLPFKVTVGTGVFFTDERFSNNLETQWAEGYWLQDAFITYHATKNLDLRLNFANLWDKEYIDRVGGGHAIPGVGRTVVLTAAFNF